MDGAFCSPNVALCLKATVTTVFDWMTSAEKVRLFQFSCDNALFHVDWCCFTCANLRGRWAGS